ncbi:MAG TPA: hypothetical protein DCZ12_02385 [Gammaproteobacteria bacterium]|nr:hypothetical protein [Gammaproteobacteria bacterium]
MRSIRGGRGLGDAMYVQAVARHLVHKGEKLRVYNDWPDLFLPLGDAVVTRPFSRAVDITAHYSMRKDCRDTNQFEDCCIQAGLKEPADLMLDWTITDHPFIDSVIKQAKCKPICLVQMYREPMNRKDGFGLELLPDPMRYQAMIDDIQAFKVLVGGGKPLHPVGNVDLDLTNKTSVCQLMDLAYICDAMFGFCSFMVPMAEQFDKRALFLWSRKGTKSQKRYIKQITPKKILHKSTSQAVFDDDPEALRVAESFL